MTKLKKKKIYLWGLCHPPSFLDPYRWFKKKKTKTVILEKAAAAISDHTT